MTTSEKRLSVVYGISDYPVKRSEREIAMAFDETLAQRIRDALARKKNIEEKKMFGGVGFLLNGNLLVGVWKESLIARLGPQQSNRRSHLARWLSPGTFGTISAVAEPLSAGRQP